MKSFSCLVIILFVIGAMPFAIAEYDENVGELIENDIEFKTYSDNTNNFSIDYPSFWSVDDDVFEYDAEPGIDDGGLDFGGFEYNYIGTSSVLGIYTLYNHIFAGYDDESYLDGLENLITDNCTNGEAYFGYTCSNQTIVKLDTIEIDGKKWYQIIYTFDAVYYDDESTVSHYRNIITETIVDDDIWGIGSTNYLVNDNKQYAMPQSVFLDIINSFKFVESTQDPSLSENVKVSNFQVTDLSGNKLDEIIFGKTILVQFDLTNLLDVPQEFVYNLTYENQNGVKNIHPLWIQGNLPASYILPASLMPEFPSPGEYALTIEIWNNNEEKIPIAPITNYSLTITPDPNTPTESTNTPTESTNTPTESTNTPTESTNTPTESPVDLTKQIASFVDKTKDPQSYVDRYNNEESYKDWFDSNYSDYDSIYQAVGLDEPVVVPEIPIFPDYTPDQHRLLGIIDGIQSYQNTAYGFTIDFPSSLLFLTDFTSFSNYDDSEPIVQFSGYPPISKIIVENYPNQAISIDDKKYLENLEENTINFDDTVSYSVELNPTIVTSSEITSIDNHKAYQVIAETTLDVESPEKLSALQTVIVTDIVNGDDILSITIANLKYETELDTSSLTLFSPFFTIKQLDDSLDSFKFTTEKLSKKYVNSDVGFEITLLDDWAMRDYSSVINLNNVVDGSTFVDDYMHESFKHLVSSVKLFPDNSNHLPGIDTVNIDIGTKDDLFVNQSPADFLTSYQNKHYELMNKISSVSCDLLLPQSHTVNSLESFQSGISCGQSSKITYTLFLTKDHFVLVYFIDRESMDQSRFLENISDMMESIEINKVSLIDDSPSNESTNDDELQLIPEPIEPSCGVGTESVNGICKVIKNDDSSDKEPSFIENIFGFFKNLFN